MGEWNFWQIPHTGVVEANLVTISGTSTGQPRESAFIPIRRALDMKISNFGTNNVGLRMSEDYNRTRLTFETKDELADINVITADTGMGYNSGLRGTSIDENPFVWGSTVKKTRDDQFFRMTMEHPPTLSGTPAYIDTPNFDVMDTNVAIPATASGVIDYKNYPSEGWRSFGGKYDFEPYTGTFR